LRTSAPFATAVRSLGAVSVKSNGALSRGWSLDGNTVCAQFGWPAMTNPSGDGNHAVPVSGGGVGQTCAPFGSAWYVTVTEKRWLRLIAARGVTISSAPCRT
jgi:hypothetical protein